MSEYLSEKVGLIEQEQLVSKDDGYIPAIESSDLADMMLPLEISQRETACKSTLQNSFCWHALSLCAVTSISEQTIPMVKTFLEDRWSTNPGNPPLSPNYIILKSAHLISILLGMSQCICMLIILYTHRSLSVRMRTSMTNPASRAKAVCLTERRTKRLWTSWLIQVLLSLVALATALELVVYEFSPLACWIIFSGISVAIPAIARHAPTEMPPTL